MTTTQGGASASERLRQHEHDLQQLTDALPVLVSFVDRETRYRFVNRHYEDWFSLRRENIQGRTVREIVGETAYAAIEGRIQRTLNGERVSFEQLMPYKERPRHVRVEYIPHVLADGPVDGFYSLVQDVTEAKRAEAALMESEARFRQMADATPQIIWITDAAGRTEFFNRQWSEYTGASEDPATAAQTSADYVHPDDAETTMQRFEAARRTRQTFSVEHRIRSRSGEYRWFLVRGEPYRDASGAIVRWFGASVDIHDRKLAEAALRESEEDYRHAAELNPQVAWTARPDGQLDRVAHRWMEWTGSSGLGSSYAEGLHPEDVERTFEVWGRSVATGEPYDIVHRVRRTSGECRWIRSRASPRRDETGRIVRWYGTTEDIHEQKTAEDHLKLMVLELNHRVKNNLATVQAIAVQTLRGTESPEEAREAFLRRISALAAAHDVLTREQWEGVSVADVAHGVLDALTGPRDQIDLTGPDVRLSPRVALSLSMAFHELGANALKHGALRSPDGRVAIAWSAEDGDLTVRWTESCGPAVVTPQRRGFGSRLLERGLAAELNGRVRLDFEPAGLVCTIEAPSAATG